MWSKTIAPHKVVYTGYSGVKPTPRKCANQAEFAEYLRLQPQLGDFVYYPGLYGLPCTEENISIVVRIRDNYGQADWDTYSGYPRTHDLVSINGYKWNHSIKVYPRTVNISEYLVVPEEKMKELMHVKLQDYLTRVAAEIKQAAA